MTHHPHMPPQPHGRVLWLSSSLLLVVWLAVSQAQMRTTLTPDGTLGTTVTQNGNLYTITGGTRPRNGPNLFHSFDRLSVGTGDTASFTGPTGIATILSRVTGGQRSDIDGTLRSEIPGAHLFLLNPSGVLFGSNARLEVSGSFHVSTADFLRFTDGATFSAHVGEKSTLTVAAPAAFGFLGPTPAPVTMQGSALQVPAGQTISVVGGDITLVGNGSMNLTNPGPTLGAPGGRIHLVSVASPGEVGIEGVASAPDLGMAGFTRLGRIDLSQGAVVTVGSGGNRNAGEIEVRGGKLTLGGGSQLDVSTQGAGRGGTVTVIATEALTLTGDSRLTSSTSSDGAAGRVVIKAPLVSLKDQADIQARAQGNDPRGNAGEIEMQVGTLALSGAAIISNSNGGQGQGGTVTIVATEAITLRDTARVTSNASSSGAGGQIVIKAPSLSVTEGAGIRATTTRSGKAGDIRVEVGTLTLSGRDKITNIATDATDTTTAGGAGNVTVIATEAITLAGPRTEIGSSTRGSGDGGKVVVKAPLVSLKEGAKINASTEGAGRGGSVEVQVGTLTLIGDGTEIRARALAGSRGDAGDIRVEAGTLTLTLTEEPHNGIAISSSSEGTGRAGNITVEASEAITLAGYSRVTSNAHSGGDGGRIFVKAPVISLMGNFAGIRAQPDESGNAGEIEVQVGTLMLKDGATIGTNTTLPTTTGRAGTVTVVATEAITLTGRDTEIGSSTRGSSDAGRVFVSAPVLRLMKGARIRTEAVRDSGGNAPSGNAGDIIVQAGTLTLTGGASILSSTEGAGRAGDITLNVGSLVAQGAAALTSSSTGTATGNAGAVLIQGLGGPGTPATTVQLTNSQMLTRAEGTGAGGNIGVRATEMILTDGTLISATAAGRGNAGAIQVDTATFRSDGSVVTTEAHAGAGGAITLHATTGMVLSDTTISTTVTGGSDPARPSANLLLTTPTLTLTGGRLAAETQGAGSAGNITMQVGTVEVQRAAQITSSSTATATGAAGTITIQGPQGTAADALTLTQSALLTRADGDGTGGNIVVQASRATFDGATLAVTANAGAGGTITVEAPTSVAVRGTEMTATVTGGSHPGGDITLRTPTLTMQTSRLAAETQGAGQAGAITLAVGTLTAQETTLTSSSTETATGNAGTVLIQGLGGLGTAASRVTLAQSTLRTAADGTGAGGAITVAASEALMLDRTTLSATVHDGPDTLGGSRGDLTLRTPVLTLLGTRVEAETTGTRRAGDITLNVGSLVAQGATLTSSSTGTATGNAGTILIQGPGGIGTFATRVTLTESGITTDARVADGGDIQVRAQGSLWLQDSQITTAVHSGQGSGGNIRLDPDFVILERSQIRADAFRGPGGNIRIVAQGFVTDAISQVSASSAQNVNGLIDIQAFTTPSGLVAPLPLVFAAAAALLRSPCAARLHEGTVSTLVERGRAGVPATPDGVLPSRLPLDPLSTATPAQAAWLPSADPSWLPAGSQRSLSGLLPLRGWAASTDAIRLLPGDCASR